MIIQFNKKMFFLSFYNKWRKNSDHFKCDSNLVSLKLFVFIQQTNVLFIKIITSYDSFFPVICIQKDILCIVSYNKQQMR